MKEHEAIRHELLIKQNILTERLNRITQDQRQAKNADFEEQAVERENDTVLDALDKSMRNELNQIESTLVRMDVGEYGICSKCSQPISSKRLKVLPHTNVCVICAAEM